MTFQLSSPDRPIEVGVILMSRTEVLDVAPIDLLHGISKSFIDELPLPEELKALAPTMHFHWVTEHGSPAKLTANMTLSATDSFDTCPALDIVLIGAPQMGYKPSETELAFIRKSYDSSVAFLTICGGVFPAQAAGVLAGKTATAPRFMVQELQKQDPRTNWIEKRYVHDGKNWTSGALLNGLDLMREFMLEHWPVLTKHTVLALGGIPIRDVDYPGTEGLILGPDQ